MDWVIEFTAYWYDCGSTWKEQTINVTADTKEEAEAIGRGQLSKLDAADNRGRDENNPMVDRQLYRCVELDEFSYNSSAKEPELIGFTGYFDVTISLN